MDHIQHTQPQTYAHTPIKDCIFAEVRKHRQEFSTLTNSQLNATMFYVSSNRLTYHGFLNVKRIFTAHSFEVVGCLKPKHYLGMSTLNFPYYVTGARFIVFSESDAIVIKLSGGVIPFLENCFSQRPY